MRRARAPVASGVQPGRAALVNVLSSDLFLAKMRLRYKYDPKICHQRKNERARHGMHWRRPVLHLPRRLLPTDSLWMCVPRGRCTRTPGLSYQGREGTDGARRGHEVVEDVPDVRARVYGPDEHRARQGVVVTSAKSPPGGPRAALCRANPGQRAEWRWQIPGSGGD